MNSRFKEPDLGGDSANGGNWADLVLRCGSMDIEHAALGFIDRRSADTNGALQAQLDLSAALQVS